MMNRVWIESMERITNPGRLASDAHRSELSSSREDSTNVLFSSWNISAKLEKDLFKFCSISFLNNCNSYSNAELYLPATPFCR
jgi:hypothetical protein